MAITIEANPGQKNVTQEGEGKRAVVNLLFANLVNYVDRM